MFNLKNLFTRALLALMLAGAAGAALASPTYRVTIDTSSLAGDGVFDFGLLGYDSSAPAMATLNNFRGRFGDSDLEGDASGSRATGIVLGNSEESHFLQWVRLGGLFRFDVHFDVDGMGDGSAFSTALYKADFSDYLLTQGNLVDIGLLPGQLELVDFDSAHVNVALVNEVPEPASQAQLALGLALMAWTARRRRMG